MLADNTTSFRQREVQIARALGVLKRNGVSVNLPDSVMRDVQAQTLFDGDDAMFKDLVEKAEVYYEYGCGKSTEYVLRQTNSSIFAVDTSRDWVEKVQALSIDKGAGRLSVSWVDVGPTGDWGMPLSFKYRHRFAAYAELLWRKNIAPDVVLIDGRFRVSCFLATLQFAPVGTKVIFDDYIHRPHYHVAEEFARKIEACGRQVLFEVSSEAKAKVTEEVRLSFQNVMA